MAMPTKLIQEKRIKSVTSCKNDFAYKENTKGYSMG